LACLSALRSGCSGFLPRFFLQGGSGVASTIGGLFWGPGGTRGFGFGLCSSSSEEEEEADDERPEDEEEEERLSLAAAGSGC